MTIDKEECVDCGIIAEENNSEWEGWEGSTLCYPCLDRRRTGQEALHYVLHHVHDSKPASKWIVGTNMPGYMPDTEPHECRTHEHAKHCIIETVLVDADEAESDAVAKQLQHAANDMKSERSDFTYIVRGDMGEKAYWVRRQ